MTAQNATKTVSLAQLRAAWNAASDNDKSLFLYQWSNPSDGVWTVSIDGGRTVATLRQKMSNAKVRHYVRDSINAVAYDKSGKEVKKTFSPQNTDTLCTDLHTARKNATAQLRMIALWTIETRSSVVEQSVSKTEIINHANALQETVDAYAKEIAELKAQLAKNAKAS